MCVCGLGDWLPGERHCIQNDIWLGSSLGASVASEGILLCEAAMDSPRAMVAFDSRTQFPIRARREQASGEHARFMWRSMTAIFTSKSFWLL